MKVKNSRKAATASKFTTGEEGEGAEGSEKMAFTRKWGWIWRTRYARQL